MLGNSLILDVDNLIWIKIIKTAGGNVGNGISAGGFCDVEVGKE